MLRILILTVFPIESLFFLSLMKWDEDLWLSFNLSGDVLNSLPA